MMFDIEGQTSQTQQIDDNCCDCETKPLNTDLNLILAKNVIQDSSVDSPAKLLSKMRDRREARQKRWIVTLLAFGNFCVAAGVSIQGPFFPKEAESKGATPIVYSSIFSVYELVMLLTSFKFGQLVTKISANLMCGFGLAVAGISTVAFGMLDHLPNGLLFIIPAFNLRIIESLGATAFATSSYSLITYRFADKTATMFSIMETCFGLGLIVGPVMGGALYQLGGYFLPFLVLGIFLTTSASLILCYLTPHQMHSESNQNCRRQSEPDINSNKINEIISVSKFISNPIIILDSIVILTALSLIGFNAAALEPHIRSFQLSPLMTGLIFVTLGLMYAITAPVLGKICDKFTNCLTLTSILGTFLCLIGLVLIGPIPGSGLDTNLWLVVISLFLFGVGTAAKQVSGYTHALNYSIQNRGFGKNKCTYGLVSGLFFSCISLGGFMGPTIAGVLIESYNFKIATIVMFVIELILLIVLLICFMFKKTQIK